MLRLRPYKPCDAGMIVTWFTSRRSFYLWAADRFSGYSYPISDRDLNDYYEREAHNPDIWTMTAFDEDGVCGQLMMRYPDDDHSHIHFGHIIVRNDLRGRGYGRRMVSLAASYAFEFLEIKRITLGVFDSNAAAIHCYQSVGFELTGHSLEVCLMNENWTCLEMELTPEQLIKIPSDR